MDLPTYTNIWRIEKRLYKLYDLRLPMPLPLVQIGVFAGVFVPWILLLRVIGVPFESPWHVLYVVPPGILTWMATRPVIEGKRLTELLISQTRYMAEPRTWCRLTPIREPREVVVVARVWRRRQAPVPVAASERAALKSRRKTRKRRRAAEQAPAAPRPVFAPTPAVASAPQPLAQVAAQREYGTLGTEDDVRVAGSPEPRPWRPREEQAPAAIERPPATPHLELSATGKRAFASGVRRPGSTPEVWQSPQPSRPSGNGAPPTGPPAAWGRSTADEHRPAASGQPGHAFADEGTSQRDMPAAGAAFADGTGRPDEGAPGAGASGDGERAPAAFGAVFGGPGRAVDVAGAPNREPQAGDASAGGASAGDAVPADGVRDDDAEEPSGGEILRDEAEVKEAPAHGGAAPVTRPDIPVQQVGREAASAGDAGRGQDTRPDIPQVGERVREGDTRPDMRRPQPTRPDIPMVPAADSEPPEEETAAPPGEPPKPWSDGLSRPLRPATTDALVWPPVPAPRSEEPETTRPTAAQRHEVPAHEPPPPEERTTWPAAASRPAPEHEPSTPQHEATWPAAASHPAPEREVVWPGADGRSGAVEEEPPPPSREVRSGPASPVRPRPLPPPPAAPPSEPAIMPPGPEHEADSGGLRRLIQAVSGGHGEADAEYLQRIQATFQGSRHIVVLGCTGGAGQTVTGLMLGHTFAQHNGEPVVAIDINPGPGALARRTRSETNETLTGLITRADQVGSLTAMRRYTSQAKSGLEVIAAGKNPLQALDDRDYALAIKTLDRFYSITLMDAAAAVVARVLPYADQLVLVAPASDDAPRAVAMTYEWLDGHGYEELRSRAVTVINGVSRRSMDDVEQAEAVARGRCRALVRIPWDDHLSMDRAPRNELKSLRSPTRRAYLALAGVVAGGFTVVPERYQEIEQEQEATR